ncbi:MAG TPA: heme exporter protein CcmB [Longimicrobiales bacterium]|nr:heme exporter protein CcmB [Longimicrobiales bacterium]
MSGQWRMAGDLIMDVSIDETSPRQGMRAEWSRIAAIVWKDLTMERRAKANFNSVAFLAALILLMFAFAIGPDAETLRTAAGGVIWLTVLFSGVLSFNRAYEQELEGGSLDMLVLYPGDRRAIYVGKLIANLTFLLLVEVILLVVAGVLYDLPLLGIALPLSLVVFLGTVGFVALGTFYAAMASRLRAREVLLPLLLFPMLIPLLIASVEATNDLLSGSAMGNVGGWMRLLLVFDVIFVAASVMAFEYVIED